MLRRTWKIWVLLAGMVYGRDSAVLAAEGAPGEEVTIAVHNDAQVASGTLARAEQEASWAFKGAGIAVRWVNCGLPGQGAGMQIGGFCSSTDFPRLLQVRIVARSNRLSREVFGVSYLGEDGTGCYSDVFLEPAEELREHEVQGPSLDLGAILGYVVAHEIGHLLLGKHAHSNVGIMRAHWGKAELDRAEHRQLLFTDDEGQTMRRKLLASRTKDETSLEVASDTAR